MLYESFSPTSDSDSKYAEEIFYKDGDQRVPTGKLLMEEQIIPPFANVCGKDANQNFDKNKVLFSMASGNGAPGVTLTIRIWLEGSDERCQASISAQQIDLKLKFAAFTEEELQNAQS